MFKTLETMRVFLSGKDLIDRSILNVQVDLILRNLVGYINESEYILKEHDTDRVSIRMSIDRYQTTRVRDFIKHDDGKLMLDSDLYLTILIDATWQMLELYMNITESGGTRFNNVNSKVLYRYIINIVDIYRSIYDAYDKN